MRRAIAQSICSASEGKLVVRSVEVEPGLFSNRRLVELSEICLFSERFLRGVDADVF